MNILKKGLALALTVAALGGTLVSQAKAAPIPDDLDPYLGGSTIERYLGAEWPSFGGKCEAWSCSHCINGYTDEWEYYGRARYLHNRERHRAYMGRECDDYVNMTNPDVEPEKWAHIETDSFRTVCRGYRWFGAPRSKYGEV